jgi:hypothetical protein
MEDLQEDLILSMVKMPCILMLTSAFLSNTALNGQYPVMIEITYLDKGTGSFQLFYDGKNNANNSSITVICSNTNVWKKVSVTLKDAHFGNRGT